MAAHYDEPTYMQSEWSVASMSKPDTGRLIAYNKMVDQFRAESDRAAAILAVSFLDNNLRRMLLAYMVDHPRGRDFFESDRPLATFSSRITLAFGLGLLSPDTFSDLNLIRKIRNHFAHSEEAATFDSSPSRDWCAELWVTKHAKDLVFDIAIQRTSRDQFLLAVGFTTLLVDSTLSRIEGGTVKRLVMPGPLSFGS
jgi:mannitol repressor